MATTTPQYIPAFPYTGNQVIITSGRAVLHAKDDSVMLFGKKSIALSSLGTLNVDVTSRVILNSPKIELGLEAERYGEPVLLGNSTKLLMERLLKLLTDLGKALANMSNTELEKAIPGIAKAAQSLALTCPELEASLKSLLSNVTYTK